MVIVLQSSTSISLLRMKTRGTTPDSFLSPGESILDYNLELLGRQPKVRLVFLFFLASSCIAYFCFIDVCISCIKKIFLLFVIAEISAQRSCKVKLNGVRAHKFLNAEI